MSGESASQVARRQRAKAQKLEQSAELWERGAAGERATASALAGLPTESWTVFHDLRWPGRRYANIDHVVVGPPGVFVIDSKNWSGRIEVQDGVLRQNGRFRESSVVGVSKAALAVGELTTAVSPGCVRPILCFVRDEKLIGWTRDVMVCSTANLVDTLLSLDAVWTPAQVGQASVSLNAMLRQAIDQPPLAQLGPYVSSPAPRPTRMARVGAGATRFGYGNVVKATVAAAFIGLVLFHPQTITAATQGFAERFVTLVTSDPVPADGRAPRTKPERHEADPKSPVKDRRPTP